MEKRVHIFQYGKNLRMYKVCSLEVSGASGKRMVKPRLRASNMRSRKMLKQQI